MHIFKGNLPCRINVRVEIYYCGWYRKMSLRGRNSEAVFQGWTLRWPVPAERNLPGAVREMCTHIQFQSKKIRLINYCALGFFVTPNRACNGWACQQACASTRCGRKVMTLNIHLPNFFFKYQCYPLQNSSLGHLHSDGDVVPTFASSMPVTIEKTSVLIFLTESPMRKISLFVWSQVMNHGVLNTILRTRGKVLYCIVLKGWQLLPNGLLPF